MNRNQPTNNQLAGPGEEEDPLRKPLGPPSPTDTPKTSCIKENLYRVTSIPIDYCLSQMEHSTAGSNNRSGFRGVRQVSLGNKLLLERYHFQTLKLINLHSKFLTETLG